eukprot:symbB.v1.2.039638.t1/scaffold6699.1/size16100/1
MARQLERLLEAETRAGKEAEAVLSAREDEKAQLQVLLRHKDRRLRQECLCAGRLRRALSNATSSAGYYMLLCTLRSWRELAKRRRTQRKLERTKVRRQEVLLRFSCHTMAVQLRRVAAQPLAEAMHRLWLHAAHGAEVQDSNETRDETEAGRDKDHRLVVPVSIRTQVPEDQVLYGTPRKKPVLEVSPSSTPPGHASKNFHLRSPFSEASTRATSSSLCPKVVQTVPLVCAAVARLAIVFNRATLRCSVRGFEKLRMNARSKCGQTDDLSEWEGRCAKLESLVTRQVAWRVGAEKRLLDLATRGEKLEKQRDLLRRKYKASQSALDAEERRVTRLRTALAEAEEASEAMNRGAQQRAEQLSLKGQRNAKTERSTVLTHAREELQSLSLELNKARMAAGEPVHLGQESFLDLQAAWQRERDEWVAACDALRRRTEAAEEEAEEARRSEAAVLTATTQPVQVQEDSLHLKQLYSELQQLMDAAKVTGELEAKAAKALSAAEMRKDPCELDEVLAYEALVARLQSELRWEKERRQSCDQALETLRGSYGLLLGRASYVRK